jgi:hypothetical protein
MESRFLSRQGKEIYIISKASRPGLGPIRSPNRCSLREFPPEVSFRDTEKTGIAFLTVIQKEVYVGIAVCYYVSIC